MKTWLFEQYKHYRVSRMELLIYERENDNKIELLLAKVVDNFIASGPDNYVTTFLYDL